MPLGESPDQTDETPVEHSKIYQYAVERFDDGCKLDHDAMNVWVVLGYAVPAVPMTLERLKPVRHYQEYVEGIDQKFGENGVYAAMIMQRSDPQTVAAFDALAVEFNADLERIKREKDFVTAKQYLEKAKELVYSKK